MVLGIMDKPRNIFTGALDRRPDHSRAAHVEEGHCG
jgi:hypothetical protein